MSTNMTYALPASYAQLRLWLEHQLNKTGGAYNILKLISIKGDLNEEALERSVNKIVNRHETLRTSFEEEAGGLKQIIRTDAKLELKAERLQGSTPEQRRREAKELASRETSREFDLSMWPLMRVRLLRVDQREHLLMVVMHHIISDGWSIGVLFRELGSLYDSYSSEEEPKLEELEIQYADYAQWQRQWLESGELEKQMKYWTERMKGAAPALEIPTDYARPALQSYKGASERVAINREAIKKLKRVSSQEGVTLFMTLIAAFDALLSRYCNQRDIVVGAPIANRNMAEIEGLIGFFANILVLRVEVDGRESFRDLLKKVKEMSLGAYVNQDVPFEKLVEELQPERNINYSPLVQVMFNLHNQPAEELSLRDLELEVLPSEYEISKFDLTLTLNEYREGIEGEMRYSKDLFRSETIRRMARGFEKLVESIVEDPDRSVSRLEMVSPQETHQVFVEWNDTATDCLASLPVHKLFESEAARNPDAVAVVSASAALTYGELDIQANRLGHLLREKGIGPEKVVGICMDRSIDLIVSELAVLKAGGAYLPIDPSYPQERISYMLASSQSSLLLTLQSLLDDLNWAAPEVISVDSIKGALADKSPASPATDMAPANLAYVIYTSGSTGRPKGVGVPHASLSNLVDWHNRAYRVTCSDRATMLAGVGFDASVWEVWPYLVTGASVHLPDEQIRSDVGRLIQWMDESCITMCFMPTPIAELALAQSWPPNMSLRFLLTGGEKLHWPCGANYSFQLINHYGPTENTVIATSATIACDARSGLAPPIGRPVDGVNVYVLDQSLCPVPIGARGELYIGGRSLTRGYIGEPNLTAERFIPAQHEGLEGERLYRTGDLVKYLGDGNLEFWGRSDGQIKIRGYRIEPGEIEAALLDHPEVSAVAVTTYTSPGGQGQLVAYVVSRKHLSGIDLGGLKDRLKKRLAPYMIPSKFVFLETLPLTANGKLDKRRLPAPEDNRPVSSDGFFLSPLEEKLAKLWAEILQVNQVGRHDNFFDMGGHSLAAMRLTAKARELLGVELDIRSIFEEPTISGLAGLIAKQDGEGGYRPIEKIRRGDERKT